MDKDQIPCAEGRSHRIRLYGKGCIAEKIGHILVVPGCHGSECIKSSYQDHHPQKHTDYDDSDTF